MGKEQIQMILRVPDYYASFHCLAGQCKKSCCIGWGVDIDEDTADYYRTVEGAFGERLRSRMAQGEACGFALEEHERCPFLNADNLCDICLELGEEALCEVCTEYPRFTVEYRDIREKSLALSCEEAGRLIFGSGAPMRLVETELVENYGYFDGAQETCAGAEEGQPDAELCAMLEKARLMELSLVQNRSIPLMQRAALSLAFAKRVQEKLNSGQPEELRSVFAEFAQERLAVRLAELSQCAQGAVFGLDALRGRLDVLDGMELLDEEWGDMMRDMRAFYLSGELTETDYVKKRAEFFAFYRRRDYEYEHLLAYFIFRYQIKAVYDMDFLKYAKFALLGLITIMDMDVMRFHRQNGKFSLDDRIDNARIYSREVEHSEDNLEYLAEALLFEDINLDFCVK